MQIIAKQTAHQIFKAEVMNRSGILLVVSALCRSQTIVHIFIDSGTSCTPPSLWTGFVDISAQSSIQVPNDFFFQFCGGWQFSDCYACLLIGNRCFAHVFLPVCLI